MGLVQSLPEVITYETDKRIGPIQLDNHTIRFNKVIDTRLKAVEPSLLALLKAIGLWPRWFQEAITPQLALTKPYISGLSALNIPHQGKQADWYQMRMLHSGKFQVVGKNYDGAPGLGDVELFECGGFLRKFDMDVDTTLCATPARAIKDILYTSIIRKTQYPGFFMLDLSKHEILAVIKDLETMANEEQKKLLMEWTRDNELD